MSLFNVSPEKEKALLDHMERLGIREDDLTESFVRSSGPGGQKVNKSSSCVVLHHTETGLSVKCQESRSQSLNRFLARRRLVDMIEATRRGTADKERQRIEKIRRQKRKRSRRAREKVLRSKQRQSEKKDLRKKVDRGQETETRTG